jgi:two-component system response regulator YesN
MKEKNMTILLADDDKNIRFTLKSMLFDILDDAAVVEARNGRELVTLCAENPPDLAFVDIQMPEMDGISAIEKAQNFTPSTLFVILTGFGEFSYAKKCIALGVLDYLLKPVDAEKLEKVVKRAEEKLRTSRKLEQSLFQTKVFSFAHYYADMGDDIAISDDKLPSGEIYLVCNFVFASEPDHRKNFPTFRHKFISNLNTCIPAAFNHSSVFSVYFTDSGLMRTIIRTGTDNLLQNFSDYVKAIIPIPAEEHIFFKIVYQTADTLRQIFHDGIEIEKKLYRTIILENQAVVSADKLPAGHDDFLQQLCMLHRLQDENDEWHYINAVELFSHNYAALPENIPLSALIDYFKCTYEINSEMPVQTWTDCLNILNTTGSDSDQDFPELIDRIKKFIAENYMSDLSSNQIADQFSITPNYLSSLFHRKTGIKLLDYITDFRIKKARQLLKNNRTASVKDIAIMVGYANPRYFSTLFKNVTGMLPTQFRKDN